MARPFFIPHIRYWLRRRAAIDLWLLFKINLNKYFNQYFNEKTPNYPSFVGHVGKFNVNDFM